LLADRAIRDPEIVALLADDPQLIAIVDALYCTEQSCARKRRLVVPVLATAVVVAAAAFALIAPWHSQAGLVTRALAATGTEPVLHVVTEQPLTGTSILDLKTGTNSTASIRTELFFDASRKLERVISSSPLAGVTDELHSASGDWINGSPVYTCAWIAAHPAAAAAARASCPAGSPTKPRPPSLDPALSAFASGYQAALRSGTVRHAGDGTISGRKVHWLEIGAAERVAIDAKSLLPVVVRATRNGMTRSYWVVSFGTGPFEPANFVRAKAPAHPLPAGETVHGGHRVALSGARRALGGVLVVPRPAARLRWTGAAVYQLLTGYAGKRPARRSTESVLFYTSSKGQVVLNEARIPDMVAGFAPGMPTPAGRALVRRGLGLPLAAIDRGRLSKPGAASAFASWQAVTRFGNLYATVTSSSKALLLETVRALVREG
jgi:hypothetical protein